jgi:polysaccharide pyruvyl transferase WcaK-like protein
MQLVLTRDSTSAAYAAELGRRDQLLTTDVVFALPRETVARERDVIVNVSGLLWFSDAHVSSASYRDSVRQLVQGLASSGRSVSLLSHVVNKVSVVDDQAAIGELLSSVDGDFEVVTPRSLGEIRRVVGSANVVVGSRMHACLNALSMGTPAVPWAYSRKFAPLMNDIGWSHGYDLRSDDKIVERTLLSLETDHVHAMSRDLDEVLARADRRLRAASDALGTLA